VAKAVVQSVQVGREFLQSTPKGVKIDAELKRLLARHQQYLGVADEVKKLLDTYVPHHTEPNEVRGETRADKHNRGFCSRHNSGEMGLNHFTN
jgi:hypothetical protein